MLGWILNLQYAGGGGSAPAPSTSRWVSTSNAAAAAQPALAMALFADLDFSDGTVHLFDAGGSVSFNGNTYVGVGDLGSIDVIDESTEIIAKTLTLTLSGVPGPLVTEAMTQDYQGRTVTLYIGIFDINTGQLIDTPEIAWEGRMDYMTVELQQNVAKLELRCENRLNREPLVARYTDVDQQLAFPGDTFFDLVYLIPYATAGWGAVSVQYPQNPGSGHTGPQRPGPGGGGGGGGGGKPQ